MYFTADKVTYGTCILIALVSLSGCKRRHVDPTVTTREGESLVLPKLAGPLTASPHVTIASRTLVVNTKSRSYTLVVPQDGSRAPEAKPLPLVLVLHGDGGDGAGFHSGYPFETASGNEAILAYPDGINATWDLDTPSPRNRDLAFLEAIPEDVSKLHPIDRSRVYAVGYSSGGFLANFFACYRPALVRAISSSAGGAPYGLADRWPNRFPKCPNQEPVAAIHLHGVNDGAVTLESGRFGAQYWAYVNGCNESAVETTDYPECTAYTGCKPKKGVVFCKVPGLNHWVWNKAALASWTFFKTQI